MKKVVMLIGLPASGKSTYRKDFEGEYTVLSRDDIVEAYAACAGISYNESFNSFKKETNKVYADTFKKIKEDMKPLVLIDKTNLYSHVRDNEMFFFRNNGYHITYVFFKKPVGWKDREVWINRLKSRPDKVIPDFVLKDMYNGYCETVPKDAKVQPDEVIRINNWSL